MKQAAQRGYIVVTPMGYRGHSQPYYGSRYTIARPKAPEPAAGWTAEEDARAERDVLYVIDLVTKEYGLEYLWAEDEIMGHPMTEGPGVIVYRDVDKTCDSIAEYSKKDAARYREIHDGFVEIKDGFTKNMFSPPSPPSYQPAAMERSAEGLRMLRNYSLSAKAFVMENFENPHIQAFLLSWALGPNIKPTQQGAGWAVEQSMREDVTWSDGEPVTAGDLVFYFDVVREFGLGGSHGGHFPAAVTSVAEVDDHTVRVEFAAPPTPTEWQTGVAMAPLVPAHFWEDHVAEARDDRRDAERDLPRLRDAPRAACELCHREGLHA